MRAHDQLLPSLPTDAYSMLEIHETTHLCIESNQRRKNCPALVRGVGTPIRYIHQKIPKSPLKSLDMYSFSRSIRPSLHQRGFVCVVLPVYLKRSSCNTKKASMKIPKGSDNSTRGRVLYKWMSILFEPTPQTQTRDPLRSECASFTPSSSASQRKFR